MPVSFPGSSCRPCSVPNNQVCPIKLSDLCVYYSGSNITGPGINTGDNLDVVITKLVTYIKSSSSSFTIQFMWVVGGISNFSSPPIAGDTTFTNAALANVNVRVSRGGLNQMGFNPGNGNTYYTKVLSSNTITFSQPLQPGEEVIVETITV